MGLELGKGNHHLGGGDRLGQIEMLQPREPADRGTRVALLDRGQDAGNVGHRHTERAKAYARKPVPSPLIGVRNLRCADAAHLVRHEKLAATEEAMEEFTVRLAPSRELLWPIWRRPGAA
jgi:hypothetical protein